MREKREEAHQLSNVLGKYHKERHQFIKHVVEVCQSTADVDDLLVSAKALPLVVNLLSDVDVSVCLEAVLAIQKLAILHEGRYTSRLLEFRVVEKMCNVVLSNATSEVSVEYSIVRDALRSLLTLISKSADSPTYIGIESSCVVETVHQCLSKTEDEEVKLSGVRVLQTMMNNDTESIACFVRIKGCQQLISMVHASTEIHEFHAVALDVVERAFRSIPDVVKELSQPTLSMVHQLLLHTEAEEIVLVCLSILRDIYEQDTRDDLMCVFETVCSKLGSRSDQVCLLAVELVGKILEREEQAAHVLVSAEPYLDRVITLAKDIGSPSILPSVAILGNVCSIQEEFANFLISKDVVKLFTTALVHSVDAHVQQVAAWALGQMGSYSIATAECVTKAGGLLSLINTEIISREEHQKDQCLALICMEASVSIIKFLSIPEALVALLQIDARKEVKLAVFDRVAEILSQDVMVRPVFVQIGGLEAVLREGENSSEFACRAERISSFYPEELVNRCSPAYMNSLIESFKRQSINAQSSDTIEEGALQHIL